MRGADGRGPERRDYGPLLIGRADRGHPDGRLTGVGDLIERPGLSLEIRAGGRAGRRTGRARRETAPRAPIPYAAKAPDRRLFLPGAGPGDADGRKNDKPGPGCRPRPSSRCRRAPRRRPCPRPRSWRTRPPRPRSRRPRLLVFQGQGRIRPGRPGRPSGPARRNKASWRWRGSGRSSARPGPTAG